MQKFVEAPRKDRHNKEEDSWFEECRRGKIPFITVKTRTKFANVVWDYITYPNEIDQHLDVHGEHITESAVSIFKKYSNKKSRYRISSRFVYFDDINISNARFAAGDLYDLINGVALSFSITAKLE